MTRRRSRRTLGRRLEQLEQEEHRASVLRICTCPVGDHSQDAACEFEHDAADCEIDGCVFCLDLVDTDADGEPEVTQ
ncbi:hypothetical protein [Natronorubrum sp. A-ect3]|uniref:hypothetical protein n=1 Tax=Natronorubrum sp. A-ect3 TaxID=3242698 RepID=UPI00359E51A5